MEKQFKKGDIVVVKDWGSVCSTIDLASDLGLKNFQYGNAGGYTDETNNPVYKDEAVVLSTHGIYTGVRFKNGEEFVITKSGLEFKGKPRPVKFILTYNDSIHFFSDKLSAKEYITEIAKQNRTIQMSLYTIEKVETVEIDLSVKFK
jgi:hypothetical protein